MVEESSRDSDSDPADPVDRLIRRIGTHPSLPLSDRLPPALGPPSAIADEDQPVRDPAAEVVVTPARIYATVELPGISRETLEVTATNDRLTIHALGPDGRVFHTEVILQHPVEPDAVTATYRNGVLDVTLPRRRGHRVRVKRGD